ncbi:hypothetical protein CYMTET_8248 [Cymbomonas tetramitiformis]|uniref:Fucosyltransferase n=1 Tax=Cymbomonas tetramitiformis TaxID=36881 RepID=A0AAE0GTK1_9CHLO|nr:hypothetical protein CYMTET_8248 [Cymbomonas tetramitiformis]
MHRHLNAYKTRHVLSFFVEHLSGVEYNMMASDGAAARQHVAQVAREARESCETLKQISFKSNSHVLAIIPFSGSLGVENTRQHLRSADVNDDHLLATVCSTRAHVQRVVVGACTDWSRAAYGNKTDAEHAETLLRSNGYDVDVLHLNCQHPRYLVYRLLRETKRILAASPSLMYVYYTEADQVLHLPNHDLDDMIDAMRMHVPNGYLAPNRLEEIYRGRGNQRGPCCFAWGDRLYSLPNWCGNSVKEQLVEAKHCWNAPKLHPRIVAPAQPAPPYLERILPTFRSTATNDTGVEPLMVYVEKNDGFLPPKVLMRPECVDVANSRMFSHRDGFIRCEIECPVACILSNRKEDRSAADAVVLKTIPNDIASWNTSAAQKRFLWHSEYEEPVMWDRDVISKFDAVMHPHRTATIKLMSHDNKYFAEHELGYRANASDIDLSPLACRGVHETRSARTELMSFIQSNCLEKRRRLVEMLTKHVEIASYGTCMNNRAQPAGARGTIYDQKILLASEHKFCLIIENRFPTDDWVTEKIYHGLRSGCVPVYFGARYIDEYLPCEHCIIKGSDYSDHRALAREMNRLDKNATAYAEYLTWKELPFAWTWMMQASKRFFGCAVCAFTRDMRQGRAPRKRIWNVVQGRWVDMQDDTR